VTIYFVTWLSLTIYTMKFLSTFAVALMATGAAAFSAIAPGAKIPSIEMDSGFPPEKVNMAEYTAGKNVFVVGLPGAFTPT
jgi:peroxiredoxin